MMTPEQIRVALRDHNIQKVARESGVSANTIYGLIRSRKTRPLWSTVCKLSDYLERKQAAASAAAGAASSAEGHLQ